MFTEHSLCARHCSKRSPCIITSVDVHNNLDEETDTQKANHLLKATQLVGVFFF